MGTQGPVPAHGLQGAPNGQRGQAQGVGGYFASAERRPPPAPVRRREALRTGCSEDGQPGATRCEATGSGMGRAEAAKAKMNWTGCRETSGCSAVHGAPGVDVGKGDDGLSSPYPAWQPRPRPTGRFASSRRRSRSRTPTSAAADILPASAGCSPWAETDNP